MKVVHYFTCGGYIFYGKGRRHERCALPAGHSGGCSEGAGGSAQSPTSHAPQRDYPHKCPRCGGAAYVGFTDFDCSKGCK